jgi:hypothetical protein
MVELSPSGFSLVDVVVDDDDELVEDRVIDLGEIHGKALEPNNQSVRMPFPVRRRLAARATVTCSQDVLRVQEIRGAGKYAEVVIGIDSRHSWTGPFGCQIESNGLKVEGTGTLIVDRPDPYVLGLTTICGGSSSDECPIRTDIWQTKKYKAHFEPKRKEFWLTQYSGTIEAGAKTFPFKVFWAPKDPRPVETLLIVDCGDLEIVVKVCGCIGGFEGKDWGRRRRH